MSIIAHRIHQFAARKVAIGRANFCLSNVSYMRRNNANDSSSPPNQLAPPAIASKSQKSNSTTDRDKLPKSDSISSAASSASEMVRSIMDVVTDDPKLLTRCANSFVFQLKPFKLHRMDEFGGGPPNQTGCTRDEALKYYREMQIIRRLEAAANSLYKSRHVRGFCHLYTGQEAICVGIENAITKKDRLITGYRAHGWSYIRCGSLTAVLCELTGRRSGLSRGKGGSMHMYSSNFYGGNGIVGAQMPIGAGIALAQKYTNSGEITIALCGDGAANQGQVFEAYNMAKLWNLPVIFVTENNGYGMGTSVERSSASIDYYTRGDYIPGVWVDGMDVLAVQTCFTFLARLCRAGRGPFVVEASSYRYYGHSVSDPGTSYRTRDEIQAVRRTADPISMHRERILRARFATEQQLKRIDDTIRQEVNDATEFATRDPPLDRAELYDDIYVSCLTAKVRGCTPFTANTHRTMGKIVNLAGGDRGGEGK